MLVLASMEDDDLVSGVEEPTDDVRAEKPGTPQHQDSCHSSNTTSGAVVVPRTCARVTG
jgi:hypothetical protein